MGVFPEGKRMKGRFIFKKVNYFRRKNETDNIETEKNNYTTI